MGSIDKVSSVGKVKSPPKRPGKSLFKSLPEVVSGVIDSISPRPQSACPNSPLPFSGQASGISADLFDNPVGVLQNLPSLLFTGSESGSPAAGSDASCRPDSELQAGEQELAGGAVAPRTEEQAQLAEQVATKLANIVGQLNIEAKRSSKIT